MKPKEVLQTLTKKRKRNEILEKEYELQSKKEDNVSVKQPKRNICFRNRIIILELLPELSKVSIIDTFFYTQLKINTFSL